MQHCPPAEPVLALAVPVEPGVRVVVVAVVSASEAVRGASAEGASVCPVAYLPAWPLFEPRSSLGCHWVMRRGGLRAVAAAAAAVVVVVVAAAAAAAADEESFFDGAIAAAVGVVAVIGGCSRL